MAENSLLKNIKNEQRKTLTENLATTYNSTGEDLLDLFGIAGALRNRKDEVSNKFSKALADDELLASKLAFYTRDIRGGLGERETARIMFDTLGALRPNILKRNLKYIPEFGRWDDLIYLLDNENVKDEIIEIIKKQLEEDFNNFKEGKTISLLSKWLPSINATSKKTRDNAKLLIKELNMSNKEYRKLLSALRAYLNITEVRLSSKDFDYINYEQVPSLAMKKYRFAFKRNDEKRFEEYKEKLQKGEVKINASTLYPYNIIENYLYVNKTNEVDTILEEQWKALPNFIEGENNFLIMADVSGSMYGRPMATSVGLAIYFSERNKGAFANKFMTFSARPELVEVKGNTLKEKIKNVINTDWEMNTNLEAAFMLVLDTALKYKTAKEELPSSIVVISDMEIDACSDINNWSFYDEMKERFENAGYQIPNIVFWNVNSRKDSFHADAHLKGVQLASGQSPSVFKTLVSGQYLTAYEYMVQVLNDERYDCITI